MLQLKNVSKWYKTGDFIQTALNSVSLNLRDNEFVSILGPSGSGKTTLLNIIGGLDHYDQGDLIINGITTQKYKDKDWDSYRNHTIGFVFQSYNLIPHQNILSNVEMALTISGISKKKRKQRAIDALEQVGLKEHMHKRPNQLSGGQMQRVAIARALVNDPDILLADEPTGALDTETSIQVMELLKAVAKDRLVVMVTHNPELAEAYSSRIVRLKDGKIVGDTDPYEVKEVKEENLVSKNMGKAKMGFGTSLALSANNLRTKKARTILTAFAGSIGIIGIALILALSSGVNKYITDIQKETMTSYPVTIDAQTLDMSSLMTNSMQMSSGTKHDDDKVYAGFDQLQAEAIMTSGIVKNDLASFKKYLDNKNSDIHKYVGSNGIIYSYDVKFDVFSFDEKGSYISAASDPKELVDSANGSFSVNGIQMYMSSNDNVVMNNFKELMPGAKEDSISPVITDNYDLVYGSWPKEYNEVVLVLDKNGTISAEALYQLGLITGQKYKELSDSFNNKEKVEDICFDYEEISKHEFSLIPACDRYQNAGNGIFVKVDDANVTYLESKALKLKISGIIRRNENADTTSLILGTVGYTNKLTDYLIKHTQESEIVKAQQATPDTNVLRGIKFSVDSEEEKIAIAQQAMMTMGMLAPGQVIDNESLLGFYDLYLNNDTYEKNLSAFGYVDYDVPNSISIYTDSFEGKEGITDCIEEYNKTAGKDTKITYVDYVALLTGSVTQIIDIISYVLIAFVAVSLIVSCIMIGIITHISVLERTKEIGILRALGASKGNVSQVFIAETVIIGFLSGLIGVIVTWLLTFPINGVIAALTSNNDVKAFLPLPAAVILVAISVIITTIGGIVPARKASKKDPVLALRTE